MSIKQRIAKLENARNLPQKNMIEVGLVEAEGKPVWVGGEYISWAEWEERCKNADRVIYIPPKDER